MNNIFIRSLPVVAMAMGNKMGVKVRIQGKQAMTDGNIIYLPVLPEGDESAWILARGYLDHEAGHVRHTDFSVQEDTPIHKALTNILEDIRIEQAMGWTYPGCAVNLRNLAEHLAGEGAFTPSSNKPEQLLLGWILSECRSRVLKQSALFPVAKKARKALISRLGDVLVNQAEVLLKKVEGLSTTYQAHDLAKEILDLLRQTQRQLSQEVSDQENKKKLKKQSSSGSGSLPSACHDSLKQILGKNPGSFGDLGQMTAEALEMMSVQAERESGMKSMTAIYPGEQLAKEVTYGDPPDLHQIRHETVALRSKLTRLVQASKMKRSFAGRVGRLVDYRTLHRLSAGNPRVFRRKEEKPSINTAVVILLDRSKSMRGLRMELARKTVLALTDALGTIPGICVSTGAFPGKEGAVVPMTPFGRTASQTRENYAMTSSGGTPLDLALGWVRVQMAIRQEPRKILLVATDGQPSDPEMVKAILKKLEAEGVELMGLGILDHGMTRHFFARHRTVQNLGELSASIFELFQEALTE